MYPTGWLRNSGCRTTLKEFLATMAIIAAFLAHAASDHWDVAARAASAAAKDATSVVTILSPIDGAVFSTSELPVSLAVRIPDGSTLLGLRVLIDGRLAIRTRGVTLTHPSTTDKQLKATHTLTVPVPPRDCVLSILAETSDQKSPPAFIRLRWRGIARAPEQIAGRQPKLYVLAIGISEYKQPDLRLRFATKDAQDLAATFRSQSRIFYRTVETRLFLDQQATKNNLLDGLEWLQRQATAKDLAVLFLAGHGITDPSTGLYYFLPYDADTSAIKRTMLPESEIRDTLAAIPGKVLLFLDSCHSGKVFAANQTRGMADLTAFISELASAENGVVVFAASTGRQSSQESPAWKNGAFTKALIEGLNGRADTQKTGRVTLNMLDLYISERVKELTDGRQTPTTAKPATIPDFPIAVVREIGNDDVEVAR